MIYDTIIPVLDDEDHEQRGMLHATVERVVDGEFVGATGAVPADLDATAQLDPTASEYQIPEGWLPAGTTSVACPKEETGGSG